MEVHNISNISPRGVFMHYFRYNKLTKDFLIANHQQHTQEHYDDYYIFMWMHEGSVTMRINFEDTTINSHTLCFLEPGTIHQFVSMKDYLEGCFIGIDKSILSDAIMTQLNKHTFGKTLLPIDEEREQELQLLLPIALKRIDSDSCHDFAKAIIDIFMECLTENQAVEASSRHFEIFLGLRSLLKQHLHEQHLPSFYAEKLCISTGYLNEVVMKTVHMSTQQYIMNETVIQAKRALYTTDDTIQHISWKLGYDDAAYFTRIFTKIAACSPSDFRKRVKG